MFCNRTDHTPYARMGPYDRRSGMAFEHRLHLGQVGWFSVWFGKWHVDIVVNDDDKTHLLRQT